MNARKFAAIAGFVAALAASLSGAAADAYRVSFTLAQDGRPFATPALVVKPGVPAAIEVSGPNGYRIDVTVDDAGQGSVKVGLHLSTTRSNASPVLIAKLGETVSATIDGLGITLTASADGG